MKYWSISVFYRFQLLSKLILVSKSNIKILSLSGFIGNKNGKCIKIDILLFLQDTNCDCAKGKLNCVGIINWRNIWLDWDRMLKRKIKLGMNLERKLRINFMFDLCPCCISTGKHCHGNGVVNLPSFCLNPWDVSPIVWSSNGSIMLTLRVLTIWRWKLIWKIIQWHRHNGREQKGNIVLNFPLDLFINDCLRWEFSTVLGIAIILSVLLFHCKQCFNVVCLFQTVTEWWCDMKSFAWMFKVQMQIFSFILFTE